MNIYIYIRRVALLLSLLVTLCACTTTTTDNAALRYGPKYNISEEELLSGEVIFGAKLTDEDLPEVKVISLNKEMEQFLDENITGIRGSFSKASRLAEAMFDEKKLGMLYDYTQTYTAIGAFENRVGNCLAFSYLYSALAKKAGIKVSFQEIDIPPEWDDVSENLLVTSRHINVVVSRGPFEELVVDINQQGLPDNYKATPMSEDHAIALYYGNLGSNYLFNEEYDRAFKYFTKALRLAPQEAPLWTNLGVLYRRKGFDDHAESAHYIALKYDQNNYSAFSNLSYLYHQMGQYEKEDYFDSIAEEYQLQNPYFRYYKAKVAFENKLYSEAMDHIKKAINKNKEVQRFYLLQAEIYKALDDQDNAEKSLKRAKNVRKI